MSSAQGPCGTGGCGPGRAGTHPYICTPSCVCKEGEVGDGRACYGHLLHEVQKTGQIGMVFLRLRLAYTMLGV